MTALLRGERAGECPLSLVALWGGGVARRTKRLLTDGEKRSIFFQTTASGVSVAQVALRYAVNANLIFKWRRDPRDAPNPVPAPGLPESSRFLPVAFLPVEIVAQARAPARAPVADNCIEIDGEGAGDPD